MDVSLFAFVVIVIAGEGGGHTTTREGGGATYPERTEEREGKNDNLSPRNDDGGNARF
jgi:hypothetical protein